MLSLLKRASFDEATTKSAKPKTQESKTLFTPWESEDPDYYASTKFIDFLDSKMRNVEHPNKNNIAFNESLSSIPDIESYAQMLVEPIQSEQTPIDNKRKSFSRRRMVEEALSKGKDVSMATTMNFTRKRIGNEDFNMQNSGITPKIIVNGKDNVSENSQVLEKSQQGHSKELSDKGIVSSNRSIKESRDASEKRPATVMGGSIASNGSIDQDGKLEYERDEIRQGEQKVRSLNGSTQKSRTISRLGNRNLYRRNLGGEGVSFDGENNKSLFAFWNKERKNSRPQLKSPERSRPSEIEIPTETNGLKNRIREVVERQTFSGKFLTNTPNRTPKSVLSQSANRTKDNRSPGIKMRRLKSRNEPNIQIKALEKDFPEVMTSNTELSLPLLEETPKNHHHHHHYKALSIVGCKDLSQITLPTSDVTSPTNQASIVLGRRRPSTTKAHSESQKAIMEGGFGQFLETVVENEGMKSDITDSIRMTNKIWNQHKGKYDEGPASLIFSAKRMEEEKTERAEVAKNVEKKLKKRNNNKSAKDSKGIEAKLKAWRTEKKEMIEKKNGLSLNLSDIESYKPLHRVIPTETTKNFYMNRSLRSKEYVGENGNKSILNQTQLKLNERAVSRIRSTVKSNGEKKVNFAQTQINFSTVLQRRDSEGTKSVRKARPKKLL